jgi:ABC-type sugar transport system substrate-binding protein
MMKKRVSMIFALFVVASMILAACATPATQAPAESAAVATDAPTQAQASGQKEVVAVSLPTMDNPLMLGLADVMKKTFGDQYDVQIASADANANNQATQVQNFTAMKAKFMLVMAVEATSLVPALKEARAAGTTVLFVGGDPGDPDAYDSVMETNQYLAGYYEAWMAKQWVDATYPDAADNSVPTAILISSLNSEAVNRSNGLKMISEPYMKDVNGNYIDEKGTVVDEANKVANPAYSSKVQVVTTAEAEMFQAGQTAMQNILTTNPDVKLVLAYAGDGGMGASQAILDEYAKGATSVITDLNKVAVFGVGMIGAEGAAVLDSATNKTVFRGTIRFGGDLIARTGEIAKQMVEGKISKVIYDPLDVITTADGKLWATPVEDTEYFVVPTGSPTEVQLHP